MHQSVILTFGAFLCGSLLGCGTTRMSDSPRTATEQMLISEAVDQAVSRIDFRLLAGKDVYLDDSHIDAKLDRGYLVSSLRQQILAHGCLLREKREEAEYVIEARVGGLGTDRHALLIGVPEMSLPTLVPGQPSRIPEIPFAKKTDQHGLAKVAVFAYNRMTGERLWQSGMVKSHSTAKDLWLLGAGPFQHGTVRGRTTLAGEIIPVPFIGEDGAITSHAPVVATQQTFWPEEKPQLKNVSPYQQKNLAKVLPLGARDASQVLQAKQKQQQKSEETIIRTGGQQPERRMPTQGE